MGLKFLRSLGRWNAFASHLIRAETAVFVLRQTSMTGVAKLVEVALDGVFIGNIVDK